MRFIHAADLHLDSPFQGLTDIPEAIEKTVHQSTFIAFRRIVDVALSQSVDFVLLVGDLFDTPEHSAAASDFFSRQLERLDQAGIPTIISFGNHDFRRDTTSLGLPASTYVIGNDVQSVHLKLASGETVTIVGFSYDQRWITDDLIQKFPDRGSDDWYIGTVHGAVATGNGDHYAPFKLAQLIQKHYDYWALGHVHAPQKLNDDPPILYSGTPQGRNVNEGGPHGYELVESEDGQLVPHYHVCSAVEWNRVTKSIDSSATLEGLTASLSSSAKAITTPQAINQGINQRDVRRQPMIIDEPPALRMVSFDLRADSTLPLQLRRHLRGGSLLNRLGEVATDSSPVSWWPVAVNLHVNEPTNSKWQDLDEKSWQTAAASIFNTDELLAVADKLYDYPELADWLDDPAMLAEVKRLAKALLRGEMDDED